MTRPGNVVAKHRAQFQQLAAQLCESVVAFVDAHPQYPRGAFGRVLAVEAAAMMAGSLGEQETSIFLHTLASEIAGANPSPTASGRA